MNRQGVSSSPVSCKDASLIPKAVINEFPNSQFSDQESSIQRSNDSYIEVRMSRE